MKFSEKLNGYIDLLSCTAREICESSGISEAALSRYRKGERVPESGTKSFDALCGAIAGTAVRKGIPDITAESVKASFADCSDFVVTDKEHLRQNFNTLIAVLDINLTRLCKHTSYDASTIFRIRNGSRKPSDAERFADTVASFVAREMKTPHELSAIAGLIGCEEDRIYDLSVRYAMLKNWLLECREHKTGNGSVAKFLNKLDEFDLN